MAARACAAEAAMDGDPAYAEGIDAIRDCLSSAC